MKQWTEEELILLYYGELSEADEYALKQALEENTKLKYEYQALQTLLGKVSTNEVPAPSNDLNERIIAGVDLAIKNEFGAESAAQFDPARKQTAKNSIAGWLQNFMADLHPSAFGSGSFATASLALVLVMVGVFYLGRVSTELTQPDSQAIASHTSQTTVEAASAPNSAFSNEASRRILLSNVSSHLEVGGRLLTSVHNSDENMPIDLSTRQQMIEDLISFNRLYRQAAERSNDASLATVLQQMERVLLQLHHINPASATHGDAKELNELRSRLNASDLLFKMKVANKRIEQEFI